MKDSVAVVKNAMDAGTPFGGFPVISAGMLICIC